jgi:hypothetical protein
VQQYAHSSLDFPLLRPSHPQIIGFRMSPLRSLGARCWKRFISRTAGGAYRRAIFKRALPSPSAMASQSRMKLSEPMAGWCAISRCPSLALLGAEQPGCTMLGLGACIPAPIQSIDLLACLFWSLASIRERRQPLSLAFVLLVHCNERGGTFHHILHSLSFLSALFLRPSLCLYDSNPPSTFDRGKRASEQASRGRRERSNKA